MAHDVKQTSPRGAAAGKTGANLAYSSEAERRDWRIIVLVAATLGIWIGFHVWTGVFISPRNLSNLAVQATITSLLAAGLTWLLVAREIDLSVGSLLAVSGVLAMQFIVEFDMNVVLSIFLVILIGISVGLLQGGARVLLGIPSFIITLAGFSWLRGSAYVISGAETVSGGGDFFYEIANGQFAPSFSIILIALLIAVYLFSWIKRYTGLMGPQLRARRTVSFAALMLTLSAAGLAIWIFGSNRGIPYPLALLIAVVFAMEYAARNSAFGRYVYAVGGNPESASRAGIKVNKIILILFALMGALAAVAGIIQTSRLDAGPPNVGLFLNLNAISAAIIGGTSLFGGEGAVLGAVIGALLMASITNGLSLGGVNTFYQMIITGVLLVVAVALDSAAQRRAK